MDRLPSPVRRRLTHRLLRAAAGAAVLLCGLTARASAQEMDVPPALQLSLFLKVLSFDRQIASRAGGTLVIGVAYQSGFRASGQAKDEIMRAAASVARFTDDVAIRFVPIDLDREDLADVLARSRIRVLYLAPVRGFGVRELAASARAARVTTITGVAQYVELGLAVGLRLRGERPQILVNLAASRLEGADFGAELLRLAQVTQ